MLLQSVVYGKVTGEAIERLAATQLPQQKGINSEPVFINVYGAQESVPRNEFSQPM
jgi:hypothetical protein